MIGLAKAEVGDSLKPYSGEKGGGGRAGGCGGGDR